MIIDKLDNAARYTGLKTGMSEAFGFLDQPGLEKLPDGKYEISGSRVYAIVTHEEGRKVENGELEAHRKYIDIQFIISGNESMGWSPLDNLETSVEYDSENDIEFFKNNPKSLFKVPEGCFAIFLPTDAHLPLIGKGPIHKVILKVATS